MPDINPLGREIGNPLSTSVIGSELSNVKIVPSTKEALGKYVGWVKGMAMWLEACMNK